MERQIARRSSVRGGRAGPWAALVVVLLTVVLAAPWSQRPRPAEAQTGPTPVTDGRPVQLTTAALMAGAQRAASAPAPRRPPARRTADRRSLLPNPASRAGAAAAADGRLPGAAAAPQGPAQTQGLSFTGATLAEAGGNVFPPDTMGAVGPTQYLVVINGLMRTFNKTTGAPDGVLKLSTDAFFRGIATPVAGTVTSGPQVRYDRLEKRWFVIALDHPAGQILGTNRVLIAFSDSGSITATTLWSFYFFQQETVTPAGDAGLFLDTPTLAVDANALYIGAHLFGENDIFESAAFVVRKRALLGVGPLFVTAFRDLQDTQSPNEGMYAPRGVDSFDPDPARKDGYLVGMGRQIAGRLVLRKVSDAGGVPTLSGEIPLDDPDGATVPIDVAHLGDSRPAGAGLLYGGDDRLVSAVIRNDALLGDCLWTARAIGVDATGAATSQAAVTHDGIRWYRICDLDGTPSPLRGTVSDASANADSYWMPSLAVSGQGHVALGFSAAGATTRIDGATTGRLAGDPVGSMRAVSRYTRSTSAYNPVNGDSTDRHEWGYYSNTSVDPDDDMTMWTIQEFANATDSWGVQVVKLLAPPPAKPTTSTPPSIKVGQAPVTVTITGVSAGGSGFFDPGSGFAKRISAIIPGVKDVTTTYVDPTTVKLTFSTQGVTPGAKSVTIVNPDGQRATGDCVVKITDASGNGGGCAGGVPSAPTNATVGKNPGQTTNTSVSLSWTDNSDNETRFQVTYVWAPPAIAKTIPPEVTPATLVITRAFFWGTVDAKANDTTLTVRGLLPNTRYFLYVRACNRTGCSAYAPADVSVTTLKTSRGP